MDHEPPQIDSTRIMCTECGYDLSGTAIGGRCPECGHAVVATLRENPLKKPVHPLAVASMALSIVALFVFPPLGLLGFVLGRMALDRIGSGDFSESSRSMARAGLVIGFIGALISLFMLAMFLSSQQVTSL